MSKKDHPELRIVLDTNAIHNQSECFLLRREVAELIAGMEPRADLVLSWYLPEVVRHEREYQMVNRATELLPAVEKLERLLGNNLGVTVDIIAQRISEAIDEQISRYKLHIVPLRPEVIDWRAIMKAATYRKPPFSKTEKEKGFRDALIAEAFVELVGNSPNAVKTCRVVLLTSDELLSEAVRQRTSANANVRILPSIEELRGLIDTLMSEVSEEFVESIKERAEKYFYEVGNPDSVYLKELAWEQLREKFADVFANVPAGADSTEVLRIVLGPPRFAKKEGHRLRWITRLTARMQAYEEVQISQPVNLNPTWPVISQHTLTTSESTLLAQHSTLAYLRSQLLGSPVPLREQPRDAMAYVMSGAIEFDITWSVLVNADDSFSEPKIEALDYVGTMWGNQPPN